MSMNTEYGQTLANTLEAAVWQAQALAEVPAVREALSAEALAELRESVTALSRRLEPGEPDRCPGL
ncbi:hypothetical protein KBTX_02315 [wastewater metagenome]|uniref:Uncharacterized protein n=2 Tax=unclassified sequences TaxID=12908 RepID=A0A5B8RBB1_9ZZZZ|nr:hypothetical protein [Arhodomonas sp. KWT]QEA05986.1 hypothetical protein KBTEX_02315 [uncultured organism]